MMSAQPPSSDPQAIVRLAHTWALRQKLTRAEELYRQAIECAPHLAEAQVGLALLHIARGDWNAARRHLERWSRLHPRDRFLVDNVAVFEAMATATPSGRATLDRAAKDALGEVLAPLQKATWDVLLYSDSGGPTSGVAQIDRAVLAALRGHGLRVVCAQPAGSEPLDSQTPHLALRPLPTYDPRHAEEALTATEEPAMILSRLRPQLVLFADGSPMSNLAAKTQAHASGTPYVSVVHCVSPGWAKGFAVLQPAMATAFRQAAKTITVSRASLELLHTAFGLPVDRGEVIYNGRPEVFFRAVAAAECARLRRELEVPADALLCLTVGRMERAKGYPQLLEALHWLKRRPCWKRLVFVWAGVGTQALYYRMKAEELGVDDHIRFVGAQSQIHRLYAAADLFILPSQYEGMPLALLEALASGTPAMATAVSGTPEALGDCGVLLPAHVPGTDRLTQALVEHIARLADDPATRAELGRRGAARARRLFRVKRMTERYLEVLLPLLEARAGDD